MKRSNYRRFCRSCERPRDEAGGEIFSYRGICAACRIANMEAQNAEAVRQTSDPSWLYRWRQGMARAAGARLREVGQRD